jgi:hypothetical protein
MVFKSSTYVITGTSTEERCEREDVYVKHGHIYAGTKNSVGMRATVIQPSSVQNNIDYWDCLNG